MNNYEDAAKLLTGRCRTRRKLENNTYLERHDDGDIAVVLHGTDVVTFKPNGDIILDTGGWQTPTTKDRMNRYQNRVSVAGLTPDTWAVYSHKPNYWAPVATFEHHTLTIHSDGLIDNGGDCQMALDAYRRARNERQRPANRLRYWVRKARGIYVDRAQCHESRWRCDTRSRWGRRRLTEGVCTCGCRVYRKAYAGKLTVQSIMAEPNTSVRLAQIHCYGLDRFLLDAGASTIDTDAGYELIQFEFDRPNRWSQQDIIRALKMVCPSTGAVYINPVPPHLDNVRAGLDWMFNTENYLERVGAQA